MKNVKKCCYTAVVLATLLVFVGTIYFLAYGHGYAIGVKEKMVNSTNNTISGYENGIQSLISKEKPRVRRQLPEEEPCKNHCVASWYRDAFSVTMIISLIGVACGLCCLQVALTRNDLRG